VTLKNEELSRSNLKLEYLVESIGVERLRSVLIPEAIRGLFFPGLEHDWNQCWEHAALCARLSEQVATAVKYLYPGEAYLAGLLHNLGVFILMSRDPALYGELVAAAKENGQDLETLEEEHFGDSHSRIGGAYAERWNFPRAITLCIKNHHKLEDKAPNPLLNIVTVAKGIAHEAGVSFEPSTDAEARFEAALHQLNLNRRKAMGLLGKPHRRHARHLAAAAAANAGAPKTAEF
jgi:HD-like signal output (HDOD) protein